MKPAETPETLPANLAERLQLIAEAAAEIESISRLIQSHFTAPHPDDAFIRAFGIRLEELSGMLDSAATDDGEPVRAISARLFGPEWNRRQGVSA